MAAAPANQTLSINAVVTLGDSSQMATNAAPTADVDIANKKYVDDKHRYAKYIYKTAENTKGAQPTADAWTKYPLSDEESDDDSIGAIALSVITLGIGTYRVRADVALYRTQGSRLRLQDTTGGGNTLIIGSNINGDLGVNTQQMCTLSGSFTITAESTIELQYYVKNNPANGLGEYVLNIAGESEYWGSLEFWKVN